MTIPITLTTRGHDGAVLSVVVERVRPCNARRRARSIAQDYARRYGDPQVCDAGTFIAIANDRGIVTANVHYTGGE